MKYSNFFILSIIFSPLISFCQSYIQDENSPSFLITYCYEDKLPRAEPVAKHYIDMDIDVIKNKINKIPSNAETITQLKMILPHFLDKECNCITHTYNLGYGLKSTRHEFYGGVCTYTAEAMYYGDYIIQLRLTISVNFRGIINDTFLKAIKVPFDCIHGKVAYQKTFENNLKKYREEKGPLFLGSNDTNSRRKQAINYFTNVLEGWPPEEYYENKDPLLSGAFDNLRYLIANKDSQALEQILFCPDTLSRLLAARTLLYFKTNFSYVPNEAIQKRIDYAISNAHVIVVRGNISFAGELSKTRYYDIVKNFDEYLKNK